MKITVQDSIESRMNKQVEILSEIEVNTLIDTTSIPWHEFYIETLDTKIEIKQDIMRITYLKYTWTKDEKGKNKKVYRTITLDNNGSFRIPVLRVIKRTIENQKKEKPEYTFIDYLNDVITNFKSYNDDLDLKRGFAQFNRVFDPFEDYTPVNMKKEKFTKMDVVKILVNNQHDKAECDGFYTDDFHGDAEQNYSKGIVGNLYLAKKIVEDNLPIMYQSKTDKYTEIHMGYQNCSFVVYI